MQLNIYYAVQHYLRTHSRMEEETEREADEGQSVIVVVFIIIYKILLLFYFMCMGTFLAWMSVYHVHAVPTEARRGHWIADGWSHRWL